MGLIVFAVGAALVVIFYFWRKGKDKNDKQEGTSFTSQSDFIVIFFGIVALVSLLVLVGWVRKLFFG